MNDELNSLTDAQLSEVFAVEVAQMETTTECPSCHGCRYTGDEKEGHDKCQTCKFTGVVAAFVADSPKFSTSADAVLPWLEKEQEVSSVFEKGGWFVGIDDHDTSLRKFVCAHAPTLPRAACLALIRAKRGAK